ncbi:Mariner Mos1 transposase [Araneus ventricosus]|uniref:Mariner Mos1 transposase n=1 Tax=Araneus ventricosus TaxID=182803 RepID=A0A4Y2C2M8_ARAVE|nr:Mariner Mos1 transposase [Araneus ventricosus]
METPLIFRHKNFKTVPFAKKVMATVFWGHQGLLLVDFHTRGATVNAASYCATLDRLHKAFRRKRPVLLSKSVLWLHVNAQLHPSLVTRDMKQRFRWEVLEQPPYSLDLAPIDFHLFGLLKKHLTGRHLGTKVEVQEAVVTWLHDLDPNFFSAGSDKLVYRWLKFFNNHSDYVEKKAKRQNRFYTVQIRKAYDNVTISIELGKAKLWLLHQDNAPFHRSLQMSNYLTKHHILVLPQAAYSPDLTYLTFSVDKECAQGSTLLKFQRSPAMKALEEVAKGGL